MDQFVEGQEYYVIFVSSNLELCWIEDQGLGHFLTRQRTIP